MDNNILRDTFFLLPLLRRASVGKVTDRSMGGIYTCHSDALYTEVNYIQDVEGGRMRRAGDNVHGWLREELMVPSPLYFLQTPVSVVGSEGWYGN